MKITSIRASVGLCGGYAQSPKQAVRIGYKTGASLDVVGGGPALASHQSGSGVCSTSFLDHLGDPQKVHWRIQDSSGKGGIRGHLRWGNFAVKRRPIVIKS